MRAVIQQEVRTRLVVLSRTGAGLVVGEDPSSVKAMGSGRPHDHVVQLPTYY